MAIPKGEGWKKWETFKKREADLLFVKKQAKENGDTDTLLKVQERLLEMTRGWVTQMMIWEGSSDEGSNDIYMKLCRQVRDGEILPDRVPRQFYKSKILL